MGYSGDIDVDDWSFAWISYVAHEAGIIDDLNNKIDTTKNESGTVPYSASVEWAEQWYRTMDFWTTVCCDITVGDIVFIDVDADGISDSAGIIYQVESDCVWIYRAAGGGICKEKIDREDNIIVGFGEFCIAYEM